MPNTKGPAILGALAMMAQSYKPRKLRAKGVPGIHSRRDAVNVARQLSEEQKEFIRNSPHGRIEEEDYIEPADAYLTRMKLKKVL